MKDEVLAFLLEISRHKCLDSLEMFFIALIPQNKALVITRIFCLSI